MTWTCCACVCVGLSSAADERVSGMTEGIHTWMNVVRSDEVKAAVALVASSDEKIEEFAQHLKPGDLRVLEADLTRTFDAFEADFPGCNSEANHDLLRRVLLCALHNVGCGYCQVSPRHGALTEPPSRVARPHAARGPGASRDCSTGCCTCETCVLARPKRAASPVRPPSPRAFPRPRGCAHFAPSGHAPAASALVLLALPVAARFRRGSIS